MQSVLRPASQGLGISEWECGGFRAVEAFHQPGLSLPRHEHQWATISVVIDGEFAEIFSDGPRWCPPGTVLVKHAGVPHANIYGTSGARCLIAEFREPLDDQGGGRPRTPPGVAYCAHGPLSRLAARLVRAWVHADDASHMTVESLFREISAAHADPSPIRPSNVQRAVEYLHDEFRHPLRLRDVAAAAGLDPTYLARAFRHHFGRTPGDMLRELRVHWAAHLLGETRIGISQVALNAGFTDQSHLTRVFTRRIGVTPASYRRMRHAH
ncbi:MAG: AraC family transcriptional regulator [Gemmatimonadaceae bacterium]